MSKSKKTVILLISSIVLFIIILITRNIFIQKALTNKEYNSLDDFKTPKEVIDYMGGKYIKEQTSTEENFNLDIYVIFKVNLYEGENSNEDYFRKTVRIMAYTLKFDSFRLIDEEKQIMVSVVCDKENSLISRTYINGDEYYFQNQDSNIEFNKIKEEKITDFDIQSKELLKLINSNWSKNTFDLSKGDTFDKYVILNEIAVRPVYKDIFNIVFRYDYSENILNNITTKTSLDEVIQILGAPTFGNKEKGLIGYKGKDIYVFFSYGQVSVYKVESYKTEELINIIKNFGESGEVKKFVSSITSMWQDYDYYDYNTDFIDLRYSLKGIKIQFNVTNRHGLIVYNNYAGDLEQLKRLKEEEKLEEIYFENENLVYEAEIERLNSVRG